MPLPLLALGLGSAGASFLGSLLNNPADIDWGAIGARYLNTLGPAYRGQFQQAYNAFSPLTLGQENAPGYADVALGQFQHSQAYQSLLANLASQANNNANAARGNAAAGANFGVGQAAFNLGNQGALMNNYIANALLQQYLSGQQQFGQLAGLRINAASDIARGAAGLTSQAMGQYQQPMGIGQRFGQGLQGLGAAGLNYTLMRGLAGGGGTPTGQQIVGNWQNRNPTWDNSPPLPAPRQMTPNVPPIGGPLAFSPLWR